MKAGIRVLIVDDSVTIRAILTRVLQSDPTLTTVAVPSAAEAEIALAAGRFDVMTLDVDMPGMNGVDYLKILTARGDLPVVMLSASTGRGNDIRASALLNGAVSCFDKADAVRATPELLRLVKAAAQHKVRIGAEDAHAMALAGASRAA